MYVLKTNTATRIPVGPLVDPTDGKTAETALTVTGLSVQLYQMKTDGTAVVRTQFAPTASGGNNDMALVTSSTDGMYDLELTATQLNFLGNARISFYDVDGFLVHWIDVQVVSAAYFDWIYGSTNPTVLLSAGTGTGQISLSSGAVTAGTVSDKTGYSLTATTGLGNQTANITGNLSGSVGSVTGAVGSVTGAVGSVGSGGITSASFATGAITATAIAADAIGASELAADAATEIGTAVWATATRTLTANTNFNDPTAAAIADAVWDEARSGHISAGSFGEGTASVQGNVTGSVGSVGTGGITSTSFGTGAITATAIAADAIGASELATDAVTEIANAVAALTIEGSLTLQNAIKLVLAAAAGKVSGADGTTVTIRDTTDTYNRITATVDQYGNRSAVSYVTT